MSERREIGGPWRAPKKEWDKNISSKRDFSTQWTGDVGCGGEIFPSFHLRERKQF